VAACLEHGLQYRRHVRGQRDTGHTLRRGGVRAPPTVDAIAVHQEQGDELEGAQRDLEQDLDDGVAVVRRVEAR
jgi:hypothetical protein